MTYKILLALLLNMANGKPPFIEKSVHVDCEDYFDPDPLAYCEKILIVNPSHKPVKAVLTCGNDTANLTLPGGTRLTVYVQLSIPRDFDPCTIK